MPTPEPSPSRPEAERPWEPLRPAFDDPTTWSIPLLPRIGGTAIRLHAVFLAWAAVELARSAARVGDPGYSELDYDRMILELLGFLAVALVHEWGRTLALVRAGGAQDRIVLWPLGGLDPGRSHGSPRAGMEAAAGGLAASAAVFLLLAPLLGVLTGTWWTVAIPTPLDYPSLGAVRIGERQPWWLLAIFTLHDTNFLLLLFHLLPMPPFAAGRITHALLHRRYGVRDGTDAAVRIAMGVAVATGFAGGVMGRWELVAVACLGGLMAYRLFERAAFVETLRPVPGAGDDDLARLAPPPRSAPGGAGSATGPAAASAGGPLDPDASELRAELEAAMDELLERGIGEPERGDEDGGRPSDAHAGEGPGEDASASSLERSGRGDDDAPGAASADDGPVPDHVLDPILAKISREGMASLTERERELLRRASGRDRP